MIIATAGHVDHGKTTLLQALTGVDADRLPEEKRRGMTIDLGYAFLTLSDGETLGFIDVPGHEKFLTNMLAGVGGVQHALLVIACDDGVMPQTKEHLAILRLLNIPSVTVALTKADRSEADAITALRLTIEQELSRQGWSDVPIFITSAQTGVGIDELREHLSNLRQNRPLARQRFRLAIDRAFNIKGSGLIVTGTALSGQISVGDTLWLTGSHGTVRVRGLHAQNCVTDSAGAGQRIAVNIVGDTSRQQIERGDWLLSERPPQPVDRVLAVMNGDKPIHHWQSVHLHCAASHTTGRVSLLQESGYQAGTPCLVELILNEPFYLAENDRFIIRDIGAKETLAGARVLELYPPRRGKRRADSLDRLNKLASAEDDRQVLRLRLNDGALSMAQFGWARQLTPSAVRALIDELDCLVVGDIALEQQNAVRFQQILLDTLARYHEQHSDQLGLGRARLKRMALPTQSEALINALIDLLLTEKTIINSRGWLHLADYGLAFSAEEQLIWSAVQPLFGEDALWVRDIAASVKLDENLVRQTLRKAAQLGYVSAIIKDRYYLNEQIRRFAALIRAMDITQGSTNAANFRDQLGIGRKLAVQILEFFDRTGFTRRKGNEHMLRDEGLFND
jgi:selenocysteine-specific elongation factor